MLNFIEHVKGALKGEEKLWKIVIFWVFLGNMIWIQEIYILLYLEPENQTIIVPYYIQIIFLRLYFPFSIYLLWRNVKHSSQLNVILARSGSALLLLVYIMIFVFEYVGTHQVSFQETIASFRDLKSPSQEEINVQNMDIENMDIEDVEKLMENTFGPQDD